MKAARCLFLLSASISCLLFLSPLAAYSQELPHRTYFFVEVKDTNGRAIADADVTLSDMTGKQISVLKTNEGGGAGLTLQTGGHHLNVQISGPGYAPYEDVFFTKFVHSYRDDIAVGIPPSVVKFDPRQQPSPVPIKIVLRKAPETVAEREAFEAEERKRQLLLAAKRGDAAVVHKLLQAGVKANSTDAAGIPAINWAAFAGDPETIKLLLAAGADVGDKNSPGHQALLIYMAEGIGRSYYFVRPQNESGAATQQSPVELHDEVVRMFLNAGAGVNAQSPFGGTVLNLVIARSSYDFSVEAIKMVLAAKADVNAQDERGETPLMMAVEKNSMEIAGMLLQAGARASVNFKDKRGRTALINASARYDGSSLGLVKVLLSIGASANEVDADGQTALMLAAKSGSIEIVRALLKAGAGASINFRDKDGQTALIHAVLDNWGRVPANAHAVVGALIAAGAYVNLVDARGRTALMYAADSPENSKLEMARALIAAGAWVNAADAEGLTPLMLASKTNSGMIVEALLAAGAKASVNAKDKKGRTALIYALSSSYDHTIVEALLDAGASVNDVDENGKTPLMMAVERGSIATLKRLLSAHAAVNAKDKEGRTALMYVGADLADTALEFARALIAAGADVNARDATGDTPLMIAATQTSRGYTKKLQLLLRAGARVNDKNSSGETALMRLASYPFMEPGPGPEPVRFLIAAGADVNARDANGKTALMRLRGSYASVAEMAKVFVEAGANVNAADNEGVTVLMAAVQNGSPATVKILLETGARRSVNAKDKTGRTALMYAAQGYYKDAALGIIKALAAAGADVNAVNQAGQTALMLATEIGFVDVVKALLEAGAAATINVKDSQGRTVLAYVNMRSYGDAEAEMTKALVAAGAK
jgi:ankyrin repeat protein